MHAHSSINKETLSVLAHLNKVRKLKMKREFKNILTSLYHLGNIACFVEAALERPSTPKPNSNLKSIKKELINLSSPSCYLGWHADTDEMRLATMHHLIASTKKGKKFG